MLKQNAGNKTIRTLTPILCPYELFIAMVVVFLSRFKYKEEWLNVGRNIAVDFPSWPLSASYVTSYERYLSEIYLVTKQEKEQGFYLQNQGSSRKWLLH